MEERNSPVPRGRFVTERPALAAVEADEAGADIGHYIAVVRQRIWLVVFFVLVALLAGALVLRYAEPEYTAKTAVKYEPRESRIVQFDSVEATSRSMNEVDTQIELIRSPRVARAVIDALGLYDKKDTGPPPPVTPLAAFVGRIKSIMASIQSKLVSFGPPEVDPDIAREQAQVNDLLDDVAITRRLETSIMEINVSRRNPIEASKISDEFANQYILSLAADQAESYRYARELLNDQMAGSKARLQAAERRLYEFASRSQASVTTGTTEFLRSDLRVLEQNRDIAIQTMRDLNVEIERVRGDISESQAEVTAGDTEEIRSVLVAKDPQFGKILDHLRQLQIDAITMQAENTGDFPELMRGQREIETIKSQLDSAAAMVMTEARGRLALGKSRLAALQARLKEQEDIVLDIQKLMIDFGVLARDVESERELFTSLLDRSKQVGVTEKIAPSAVTVVAYSSIPMLPTSPRVWRTLIIAGLLGLFFGVGTALLIASMDRSIKDPASVEAQLGLPSLGYVPFLSKGKGILGIGGTPALITDYASKAPEAEAFRYIRTSLQYASAGKPPQVLVVTSCVPQEGKSTTSANLALSFAEKGQRTLLIDGDLKAPTIHRVFGQNRLPGLSDVLTGQVEFAAAIRSKVGSEWLDILPAGPATPSPVDLLDSAQMASLIEELRKTYSTIIIDSAPCHGMADAMVLSRKADGVLIVVNPGKTIVDLLHKSVSSLDRVGAHIFGVVYNSRSRSLGNASMYGYGYGYGYGRKDEKEAVAKT